MADITGITAIRNTDTTRKEDVTAGVVCSVGDIVYPDTTNEGKYALAVNSSEAAAEARGICLQPAVADGPLSIATGGNVVLVGASMSIQYGLVLSDTAKQMKPDADLASNEWVTAIGRPVSTTEIKLSFQPLRVQVP
jgi:hypothetical protein